MNATKVEIAEALAKAFAAVQPLICSEWPAVDAKALEATEGKYDEVVELVASTTEHSKTLIKRHLGELVQIAQEDAPKPAAGAECCGDSALGAAQRSLQEALRILQGKATEVSNYVRNQALTDAKHKAEQNPLVTLLVAIGLGFIFGFLLRGLGRDRYPRNVA
jgi:hypothetical protein